MTFYGASVIHPNTIKPIENKNIPLEVRSFIHPETQGTLIGRDAPDVLPTVTLHKSRQALVTLRPRDFSFMDEERLQKIFSALRALNVNLIQRSAVSLKLCVDESEALGEALSPLTDEFVVETQTNLTLRTCLYPQRVEPPVEALITQYDGRALHVVLPSVRTK
jgi:aspartate kinase